MNTISPLITGTTHSLPFDKLSPEDFERLCFWLIVREGFESPEHLGASGNDQGRDIVAQKDGQTWAFQCKRVQYFGPKDAEAEVDKVLALPESKRPARLVFIVTANVSDKTRERVQERCLSAMECEFWSLTKLEEKVCRYPDLIQRFFQLPVPDNGFQESRYRAGERLRILREQLDLKPSKFIEVLGLRSEATYLDMEANEAEVPLSLLEQLVDLTGVELDWLKHGSEPMCPVGYLSLRDLREGFLTLLKQNPQNIFFTVDSCSLFVGLCVQVSKFRFRVYKLNMAMDFWNWVEDFWYIPQFYAFLYKLPEIFPLKVFGYDITKSQHEQLYLGKVHPLSIVSPGITKYHWVVEALTDLDHEGQDARRYTKQYGRWLFRVHREFKKYRVQISTTIAAFEEMIHV